MIAPPWFELPPAGYGGIEAVVADLVDQLSLRGHHVTLVGAGRHRTRAETFVSVFAQPPSVRLGTPLPEVVHAAAAAAVLSELELDIVHDHTLAGPLLAGGRVIPTVVTMHGPATGEVGDYYRLLGDSVAVVAISNAQRATNPALNWAGTVYNATDVASYPFQGRKSDYLLWLGRFCEDKAPHLAIEAARAVERTIILAGKCNEPGEKAYFDREIAPRLTPEVIYVGEANARRKRALLSHARALLFPVQWDEPFGMVMIEAMACGTPVVALRRGSVPEVVEPGISGVIADRPADLPAAIRAAESVNPEHCRRHAQRLFHLDTMAAGYERIYGHVLSAGPSRLPATDGSRTAEGREIA